MILFKKIDNDKNIEINKFRNWREKNLTRLLKIKKETSI